jgi:hypothetical protein
MGAEDGFNPKPKTMARSGMDGPHVAPAIAFGFGLNENGHMISGEWRMVNQ